MTLVVRCAGLALPALLLSGCVSAVDQSTLHPAGPAAAEIARLWWILCITFTAVFGLVMVLYGGIFRRIGSSSWPSNGAAGDSGPTPPLGRTGFIVAGGVVLPVVVLAPLFLVSLKMSVALRQPQTSLSIRVVGRMWWWEVQYPEQGIVTANELHIPAGQPVRLELTSTDVIHSFWVPRLHGKRDMIPGLETVFWIQADEPGVYRGQCAEYCGTQHANMAFHVVALPAEEFDAWLAERANVTVEPQTPERQRGLDVFHRAGCGQCHALRGTRARGNAGPDLTHVSSRRTLGAGRLPNTPGNLAGWIADPQALKPGSKMPRTYLAADDLLALVTYLEGLQ
jgi:cytochrome c oxidase subunit II